MLQSYQQYHTVLGNAGYEQYNTEHSAMLEVCSGTAA